MKATLIALLLFFLQVPPASAAAKSRGAAQTPASVSSPAPVASQPDSERLRLAYLGQQADMPVTMPFFDPFIPDQGLQGARLAIRDNNTTGQFTRQRFELNETLLPAEADVIRAFKTLVETGYRHILVQLPSDTLRQLVTLPEARDTLLYDLTGEADPLTAADCQPQVLKLMPSRTMRADALAQYLLKKRWTRWFLITGPGEGDLQYAAALKRAAKRFGARIVQEKTWQYTFEERRSPESEIPVLTQGEEHDVLVVADEAGLFGDSLGYRTWRPRPVVGTQGLRPSAWHRTHEAWGALQLQHRFRAQAGYPMTEIDYAAWLAVRAVGEAATRTRSVRFDPVKTWLLGTELALAGFKGVPLSFRPWDGRLRQPLLLAADRAMVAVAPIEGFLHPRNELDTLGLDEAESPCRKTAP
jgi:ABC transporter substrate binding protein (PQQ-dependent alcohol dehydrogenase system)